MKSDDSEEENSLNEYGPGWINSPIREEYESENCSGTSNNEEWVKTE